MYTAFLILGSTDSIPMFYFIRIPQSSTRLSQESQDTSKMFHGYTVLEPSELFQKTRSKGMISFVMGLIHRQESKGLT